MNIYTKTGDKGETSLIGGKRAKKSDIRIDAYGTVDELISFIGLIRDFNIDDNLKQDLIHIQDKLMTCASIIASESKKDDKIPNINETDILFLEEKIDEINKQVPALNSFILPGGHQVVSFCHIARTICRKAERKYVKVSEKYKINDVVLKYLNRLSDYLFMVSRKLSIDFKAIEIPWKPKLGNE